MRLTRLSSPDQGGGLLFCVLIVCHSPLSRTPSHSSTPLDHNYTSHIIHQLPVSDSFADEGYLCYPSEGRVLAFDGRMLHGVVPYLAPDGSVGCEGKSNPSLSLGFRI